jgi:hypothetical protein
MAGWLLSSDYSQTLLSAANLLRAETSLTLGETPSRASPSWVFTRLAFFRRYLELAESRRPTQSLTSCVR